MEPTPGGSSPRSGLVAGADFGYGDRIVFSSRRRILTAVGAAVVALSAALFAIHQLTGDASDEPAATRVVQPGAPGQPGRTLSPTERSQLPPHTQADTQFMQHMIAHHAQALEMTALVPDRAESGELPLLARRIETSQRDEIAQMQRWLTDRGEETPGPHAHHAGLDAVMPGMLTPEQLSQLARARGHEFDRLFLEFMIKHHAGALIMVEELFAQPGAGQESEIFSFASDVEADQRMEIDRMGAMLKELQR
jgi:uncharacterized protein (DUF305 family)